MPQHIKVLERTRLITRRQKAQYRSCTIDVTPLEEISAWTVYCPTWEARLDRTEITPTYRLVYTESMADEQGHVISPSAMGMPEGYPEVTEVAVLLQEVAGRTKMVMTHAGVPADSGAGGGWTQVFDKLADHIVAVLNAK